MMWVRFTDRAREIVFAAQKETEWLFTDKVESGHLALALLRSEDAVISRLFAVLAAPKEDVRKALLALLPVGEKAFEGNINLGESGKRAIHSAYEEARDLNCNYIAGEHLLLGVLSAKDKTSDVLNEFGLTLERTREAVRNLPADVRKADRSRTLYKTMALIFAALLRRKRRK